MRSGLLMLMLLATALPAAAQSVLDGPLAPPDATARSAAAKPSRGKVAAKKIHHAAARPARPAKATPTAAPAGMAAPDDPVSLGMKWQGNNDSAAQTRYNNLDGNAFGSGAEVGMKLHF